MFSFFKKKEIDNHIYAPVSGSCIPIEEVKDQVFSSKMMGDGVAFQFDGDCVYAPCNGKVLMIANTFHAIGILAENGVEILLHVGMDTVNLNGQGLQVLVGIDDDVKKGTPLLRVDQQFMKEKNIDLTTPLIITNGNGYTLTKQSLDNKVVMGETTIITCTK